MQGREGPVRDQLPGTDHRGVEVGKRDFLGVMPGFPKA
jgi:hypothetical protein